MTAAAPIMIVGGGIGGLALALGLARRACRSVVLERQETPAAAGAGIQLGPNGVRALQCLGVADALEPGVGTPEAVEVRAGATGRRLARLPLGRWIADRHGAPYWTMHRGDLYGALAAAAGADPLIEVHTGFEVASVEEAAGEVTVKDRAGRSLAAPMVVGADGLWSAVRRAVVPGSTPGPIGVTAMRTVIPAAQAGPLAAPSVGLWLSPQAHVVHYPVRQGSEIAVVVIAPDSERRLAPAWEAQADLARLQRRLAPFHRSLAEVLAPGAASDRPNDWQWREWPLYTLPPLPAWWRGRIVLLGDAAHPMLPYLAQGGALALEDAVVLADCIHNAADPTSALTRLAALRTARARRVQAASLRQGRIYHLRPPLCWARDAVLAAAPGARLMAGYDWLYAWRPPHPGASAVAKRGNA